MADIEMLIKERGRILQEMSILKPDSEDYAKRLIAVQEISKTIVQEEALNLENDRQLIKIENDKVLGQEANKINEKNNMRSSIIAGVGTACSVFTVLAACYASETRVIADKVLSIGRNLFGKK